MGGVEAPRGRGVGRGIPLPPGGRVWGGAVPTAQKMFRILLKIPYFDAF